MEEQTEHTCTEEAKEKMLIQDRNNRLERIRRFSLMSDEFMPVVLQDPQACQYVLRVITGRKDLIVKEVRTQYRISKSSARDVILDVLAEDMKGDLYNVEIQVRTSGIDHARRTRFHGAMIDSEILQKGTEFRDLPEVWIIYISEQDLWKQGKVVYHVKKTFEGTEVAYDDGLHMTYVNAAVKEDSEVGRMMEYFRTADPEDMSHGALSKRVHFLKCEEGGAEIMCKIAEEFREEGRMEGRLEGRMEGRMEGCLEGRRAALREAALNLKKMGMASELIAKAIGKSLEQLNQFLEEPDIA